MKYGLKIGQDISIQDLRDQYDAVPVSYTHLGMPKIQMVTDEASIKKYGGERMFFAPPVTYDELMKRIPYGKVDVYKRQL